MCVMIERRRRKLSLCPYRTMLYSMFKKLLGLHKVAPQSIITIHDQNSVTAHRLRVHYYQI